MEPLQANPTIIEDNCFVGARSEVVEGVIVEEGSVISMGVFIGQSTRIYDRETGEVHYGRVPAGSVVVSGNLPSKDGSYSLYCAVIVKKLTRKLAVKSVLMSYYAPSTKIKSSGLTTRYFLPYALHTKVIGDIFRHNRKLWNIKSKGGVMYDNLKV